ncbi:Glycine/D-amino acid oxidase (deaminating) [Rubellimicrobium thermophilum DSM 16684]|uniref:Glycine/D-amino acid oxidase (Deaminating) n=1 Tax=Rubellimicrobium thermophilum DSM 16684 TaxID=1123069 RepID=S9S373_9RHOB|nr:FAD-binding oxidoreductase [Rubellimicrobium thermophilum]EPX84630.1 Glycine/D-amino acid oxidase (deaminating) [Rubellimicrobium thermophilum DSM 16684]
MPAHSSYDVVIVGGAMIGSAIAWWTARDPAFTGRILVVERDPTYAKAASTLSHSCIRQQFGSPINVLISRFGAEFIKDFPAWMDDPDAPVPRLQSFGYLYLADTEDFAAVLRDNAAMQNGLGAATRILTPAEIQARWPFMEVSGLVCGSHNPVDEGYFDGATVFDWFRRKARGMGVEYIHDEVVGLDIAQGRVTHVRLASGARVAAGQVVNAAGTRSPQVAAMAGLSLPVEPRKRLSILFAAESLGQDLPLVIEPNGVFMRSDGAYYLSGFTPDPDPAADPDDFTMSEDAWEDLVWPTIAARIPVFERLRVIRTWVGQYDYQTLDQNAVLGPHPDVPNLLTAAGFSGHGFQQAPAVGRGLAEWIVHGRYLTLDLSPLGWARVLRGERLPERAII